MDHRESFERQVEQPPERVARRSRDTEDACGTLGDPLPLMRSFARHGLRLELNGSEGRLGPFARIDLFHLSLAIAHLLIANDIRRFFKRRTAEIREAVTAS